MTPSTTLRYFKLGVLCAAIFGAFLAGAYLLAHMATQDADAKSRAILDRSLEATRGATERAVENALQSVGAIARQPIMLRLLDLDPWREIQTSLEVSLDSLPSVLGLRCITTNGLLLASAGRGDLPRDRPALDAEERQSLQERGGVILRARPGSVLVVTPVIWKIEQAETIGWLEADFARDAFLPGKFSEFAALVDERGHILTSLGSRLPEPIPAGISEVVPHPSTEKASPFIISSDTIAIKTAGPAPRWRVVVGERKVDLFGQAQALRRMVFTMTTVTALVVIGLVVGCNLRQHGFIDRLEHERGTLRQLTEKLEREVAERRRAEAELEKERLQLEAHVAARTRDLQQENLERQRVQEALKEKEQFIRSVVDAAPNMIFVKDRDGRFILVNRATAEFRGLAAEAMIGMLESEVNPDASQAARFMDDDRKVIEFGQEHFFPEAKMTDCQGRAVWLQTTKRPLLDATGRPRYVLGISTDITARKQAEVFLHSVLQHLPIMVFIKDAETLRFVMWNKAGEEISGFKNEEMLGKTDFDFFPPAEADRYVANDRETLASDKILDVEEEFISRDGTRRIMHTRKIPVRDASGRALYLLGIAEDITRRKAAETSLAQAQKQLLEASRQSGMAEVATGVLHNVGNVLNSVNVSANLIEDALRQSKIGSLSKAAALLTEHRQDIGPFMVSDPRGRQLPEFFGKLAEHMEKDRQAALQEVRDLRRNVDHIKQIVARQQSYAKVSGVAEIIPPAELMEDALKLNSGAIERHSIRITRDFQSVSEVYADRHKALQILVNLIKNAKQAMDEQPVSERLLTLRIKADGENQVRLEVVDTGKGILAENLARVFQMGFTTKKDGHGFGLHSCALAAQEMGGSLHAQSDGPGRGATFTLVLPRKLVKAQPLAEAA